MQFCFAVLEIALLPPSLDTENKRFEGLESGIVEGSGLVGCDTLSLGEWCLTLQIKALLSLCDTLCRWVSGV